MRENCALYMPLNAFPSREQLALLSFGAELQLDVGISRATLSWPSLRITITRMPDTNVARHLSGFTEFVRTKGGSETLVTRIMQTKSVLGCVIEPGFDSDGRAQRFFSRLNEAGDGLWFLAGEVYDAAGRGLLLSQEGLRPPDAFRVARRTLVLLATSFRGLLEVDAGTLNQSKAEELRHELLLWIDRSNLNSELEETERALLDAPLGTPNSRSVTDAVWRAEGAQVLSWALNARTMPPIDTQEHPYQVAKACGVLADRLPTVLSKPSLRSFDEIDRQRRRLVGIDWRLREFFRQPNEIDFKEFAKKNWFGGFDLEDIPLSGKDLAIGDKAITKADPETVRLVRSIARERHHAANWLIGVHEVYSRVGTPT